MSLDRRHQGIHQHQLRPLLLEQRQRLEAIGRGQHPMSQARHQGGQQHAVGRAILGDQHRDALSRNPRITQC